MSRIEELEKLTDELTPEERDALLTKLLRPSQTEVDEVMQPVESGAGFSMPEHGDDDGMDSILNEIASTVPEPTAEQRAQAAREKEAMGGHDVGVDLFAPGKHGATVTHSMSNMKTAKGHQLPLPKSQLSLDDEVAALTEGVIPDEQVHQGPLPPPPDAMPPVRTRMPGKRPPPQDLPPLPRNSTELNSNPANYSDGELPPEQPLPPPPEFARRAPVNPKGREGRPLTFAEQVGAARKDEVAHEKSSAAHQRLEEALTDPERNYVKADLSDPMAALCPPEMREAQPSNFRPYEVLASRIRQFLENPRLINAAELTTRVRFSKMDMPSIPLEEAEAAGFKMRFVLGRPLTKVSNKWFVGYVQPSPETLAAALKLVLLTLRDWSVGKEIEPAGTAAYAQRRDMVRSDGSKLTDSEGRALRPTKENVLHRPKIHIFAPFDYPEQVAVGII